MFSKNNTKMNNKNSSKPNIKEAFFLLKWHTPTTSNNGNSCLILDTKEEKSVSPVHK